MSLVRQERLRLFATYLNTMAAGSMVAGALAPAINIAISATPSLFPVAYFALGAATLSIGLHLFAQAVLGKL